MIFRSVGIFFLFSLAVLAQQTVPGPAPIAIPVIADPTRLTEAYHLAIGQWVAAGQTIMGGLFALLLGVDGVWFAMEYKLNRYDFEAAMMATLRKLFGVGFFMALVINANVWFPAIVNSFVALGKHATNNLSLGPSVLLQQGVNIAGSLLWAAAKGGQFNPLAGSLGIGYFLGAMMIVGGFFIITIQFVICLVDTYIAIGLASYFVWLGGSRWTVSYVERYFAFCVSVGVKLMAFYMVCGAGMAVSSTWKDLAAKSGNSVDGLMGGWIVGFGALLFACICWHVSKLVSSALGGSPTLTGSDAVAFFGAVASAGLGAASTVASGGASAPLAGALGARTAGAGGMRAVAGAAGGAGGGMAPQPKPPMPSTGGAGGVSGGGSRPQPAPKSGGGTGMKVAQQMVNGIKSLPPSGHSGGTPQAQIGH